MRKEHKKKMLFLVSFTVVYRRLRSFGVAMVGLLDRSGKDWRNSYGLRNKNPEVAGKERQVREDVKGELRFSFFSFSLAGRV